MKILHLSDLHIGKKVHGYSMLEEQEYILCHEVINVINENKIEVVFIAGDVYDTSVPSGQAVSLFDLFLTRLNELQVRVYIIPGNHDSAERIAFAAELLKRNLVFIARPINYDIENAQLEKYTEKDKYGNINIYLMPYLKGSDVQQVIGNTLVDTDERNILIAHQFVTAAGYENEISDSEIKHVGGVEDVEVSVFDAFDYVALGHLHAPQHIKRDTVRYAGSILKYSFSEVDQKKLFTVVEIGEKGNIEVTKIPIIPMNDMRKIRGPIEKLLSGEVYSQGNINDYIHATITDEEEIFDAVRRLKEIYKNLLKLDFDNSRVRALNEVENIDNIEQKDELTLFEEFYENRTDMELSEDEEEIMIRIINEAGGKA